LNERHRNLGIEILQPIDDGCASQARHRPDRSAEKRRVGLRDDDGIAPRQSRNPERCSGMERGIVEHPAGSRPAAIAGPDPMHFHAPDRLKRRQIGRRIFI